MIDQGPWCAVRCEVRARPDLDRVLIGAADRAADDAKERLARGDGIRRDYAQTDGSMIDDDVRCKLCAVHLSMLSRMRDATCGNSLVTHAKW